MELTLNVILPLKCIDERTPLIVLMDIARRSNIKIEEERVNDPEYIRRVVRTIREGCEYKIPINDSNFNRRLARYLGIVDEIWTDEQLMRTYQHYLSILPQIYDPNVLIPPHLIGETPTLNQPYILNVTFLYAICLNRGIDIPFGVSKEMLTFIVKMCSIGSDSLPRCLDILQRFIFNSDPHSIFSLMSHLPPSSIRPPNQDPEKLYPSIMELSDLAKKSRFKNNGCKSITPQDSHEAIYLAAINYGFNLFLATDPLFEYCHLHMYFEKNNPSFVIEDHHILDVYTATKFEYHSQDPKIAELVRCNPRLITLNYFDPRFPEDIYPRSIFRQLVIETGYAHSTSGKYEHLQETYNLNTFYYGPYNRVSNKVTQILMYDVDMLNASHDVLVYGSRGDDNMTLLTFEELVMMFRFNQSFKNQINGDNFTPENIEQLLAICNLHKPKGYEDLIALIDLIKGKEELINTSFGWLSTQYNSKDAIDQCLTELLHIGMYMRGWDGGGEYAVEVSQLSDNVQITMIVTEQIARFDRSIMELGEIGNKIMDLPLFEYKNREFVRITSSDEGLSLRERHELIKRGDTDVNVNSCIRLSGSRYVIAAYRYRQLLGLSLPFDIDRYHPMS